MSRPTTLLFSIFFFLFHFYYFGPRFLAKKENKREVRQTAKWSFWDIKFRERNQPLHINHWGILVLFKGPWTWSQNGYRWYSSKSKSFLPPSSLLPPPGTVRQRQLMHILCHISTCIFFIMQSIIFNLLPHQRPGITPTSPRAPTEPHRLTQPQDGCARGQKTNEPSELDEPPIRSTSYHFFIFFLFLALDCRKDECWNLHVFSELFKFLFTKNQKIEKVRKRPWM